MTIATTEVDAYVQSVCKDRIIHPAMRARSASTAITVHVAQEFDLLIGTPLPVDEAVVEALEDVLEKRAEGDMKYLMAKSMAAFEAIEAVEAQVLKDARLYAVHLTDDPNAMGSIGLSGAETPEDTLRLIQDTMEGNIAFIEQERRAFDGESEEW